MRKLNNNIRISSGRHGVNLHNDKQNFANVNPMKQWKLLSMYIYIIINLKGIILQFGQQQTRPAHKRTKTA